VKGFGTQELEVLTYESVTLPSKALDKEFENCPLTVLFRFTEVRRVLTDTIKASRLKVTRSELLANQQSCSVVT